MSDDGKEVMGVVTAGMTRYTLYADRTWSHETPFGSGRAIAESLEKIYRDKFAGPSSGDWYSCVLHDLAKAVGGTAMIKSRPPTDPDVVY